jgi:hypothetical protein
MAASSLVDLRSDGEHIVGTINDRVVDLHVRISPDGLLARGMFAGPAWAASRRPTPASPATWASARTSSRPRAAATRASGACGRGGDDHPGVRPAVVELPPGFERLEAGSQAMLLALLLQYVEGAHPSRGSWS